MSGDLIMQQLSRVIRLTFGLGDRVPITHDTTAYDVDGWDSLSHSSLLILVEKEFGISITSEEGEHLDNVGTLADLIAAKTQLT